MKILSDFIRLCLNIVFGGISGWRTLPQKSKVDCQIPDPRKSDHFFRQPCSLVSFPPLIEIWGVQRDSVGVKMVIFCEGCQTYKPERKIKKRTGLLEGKTPQGICIQCSNEASRKKKDDLRLTVEQKQVGRPQTPFSELSSYTQRIRVQQAISALESVEKKGPPAPLLEAIAVKVGLQKENEKEMQLSANVAFFAETYLPLLPESSRPAAALTQGLLLKDASRLTGVPVSSISWGRHELEAGNLYANPDPVVPHPANEAKEDERSWFKEFAFSEAPVYSGSIKTRRLRQNSVADFFSDYLAAVNKTSFPKRSISCITTWLHELNLRPSTFDRYRCEICHDGREAEAKIRQGDASPEALNDKKKYDAHQIIVQNQTRVAKELKEGRERHQLIMIFDYSTVHERSEEKVSRLSHFRRKKKERKKLTVIFNR